MGSTTSIMMDATTGVAFVVIAVCFLTLLLLALYVFWPTKGNLIN